MESEHSLLIFLLTFSSIFFDYLTVFPLKLLDVRSVASCYHAATSEYRTNIENGQDEEVDRTKSDKLNGFPSMKMTRLPGGCGFYEIPIKPSQVNSMIQPAKKKITTTGLVKTICQL